MPEPLGMNGPRQVEMPVGVLVEKRPAKSRWADAVWRPVSVMPGEAMAEPWTQIAEEEDGTRRYWAGAERLTLYRADTEAYRFNLEAEPRIYVVLRLCDEASALPYQLHLVTLSPYEAQDHLDSDEDIVEALPLVPQILEFLEAFVATQPEPPAFKKRRRDKAVPDRLQFSKEPIFQQRKRPNGGGDL